MELVLLRKLKEANNEDGDKGRRRSCSLYSEAHTNLSNAQMVSNNEAECNIAASELPLGRLKGRSWTSSYVEVEISLLAKPCGTADIFSSTFGPT